jgi:hypothetical protein
MAFSSGLDRGSSGKPSYERYRECLPRARMAMHVAGIALTRSLDSKLASTCARAYALPPAMPTADL